jgi:hypothetical protein
VLRNATCDEMASDCMKERRHCNESDGMIYFSVEAVQPLRCVVRGHKYTVTSHTQSKTGGVCLWVGRSTRTTQ